MIERQEEARLLPSDDRQSSSMVWSLSKDDDHFDAHNTSGPSLRPLARESTVLVDPISQVPEAPHDAQLSQLNVERTEVLRERKVDRLRAEVELHRRLHARRRRNRLVLWAAAGAVSVVLGASVSAVVASSFSEEEASGGSPEAEAEAERGPLTASMNATAELSPEGSAREAAPEHSEAAPGPSAAAPGSSAAASTQSASASPHSATREAEAAKNAEPTRERSEPAPPEPVQASALTLDELPFE